MFLTIITTTLLTLYIIDITPHHRKSQETAKRLQAQNITDAPIEIPIIYIEDKERTNQIRKKKPSI